MSDPREWLSVTRTVLPASYVLTLAEAKAQERIDVADDDALVTQLIAAAQGLVEARGDVSLSAQTWKLHLPAFPAGRCGIPLPRPPFVSLTSLTYRDANDQSQSITDAAINANEIPAVARPAFGASWPAGTRVEITFVSGFGGAGLPVPPAAIAAVKLVFGNLYRNREAVTDVSSLELPLGVQALIDSFRWTRFGAAS